MNVPNWEEWAVKTLERRSLVEPPDSVLRRAIAIGGRRRRPTVPAWLSMAAMLAVVAIGAVWFTRSDRPVLPPRPVDSTVRSGEVTVLSPVGRLEEMPQAFVWQADERAVRYTVKMFAVDDTVLFEGVAETTRLALPSEVSRNLHDAVTYAWIVEARDDTGAIVARSQRVTFEVRP